MTITLYHNPDCGTSRNVLAVLQRTGQPLAVIEYLKDPPSRGTLQDLLHRLQMRPKDLARRRGTPFAALGLADPATGDDAVLAAMLEHPILINRPIVVAGARAVLCRPSDLVFDLVPPPPGEDLHKQDGSLWLIDGPLPPDDPDLGTALAAAGLLVADLAEAGNRAFFAYRTTGGRLVGYAGLELLGEDALLRSLLILPAWRGQGLGRAATALALRRAFDFGARRAWLLTTDAVDFFARAGFQRADRAAAPAAVRATRQLAGLCPASAVLMQRAIEP
ncbi:arsenic resistance N-acetyltransferase ArsN2 [Benzoatithermus flavus]|uniref:Arsenate reductase n=1 Tax=Benzoatithermus flavus TaxID=3108223 RepID=A0ABU8XUY1_9PROT